MSVIKMSEVIKGIREAQERSTRRQRASRFLKRIWTKIAWTLWGRRRAFAQMKNLALTPSYQPHVKTKVQIDEELRKTRAYYDSLYVEVLPRPDSDDSGIN